MCSNSTPLVGISSLGWPRRVPGVLAGADDLDGVAFIDVDDTIGEVHGYAKQAAGYGYTGVRGLNIQLATVSTPVIARARLRKGSTASAKGAGRLLAQAITTARAAGVRGQILCRADSACYGWAFVGTAIRAKTWFSVTARMTKAVTAAIASIEEGAWQPSKYPNAIFEEAEQRWISDAEVAEVPFVAFAGRRKAEHVSCRLIVRRVKRLQRLACDGTEQGELFATYRHHAFITNSTLPTTEADERHRDHALVDRNRATRTRNDLTTEPNERDPRTLSGRAGTPPAGPPRHHAPHHHGAREPTVTNSAPVDPGSTSGLTQAKF